MIANTVVCSPKKLIYAEMFLLRYWLWRAIIHAGRNLHLKKNMHVVNLNIHNITTNKLRFHFSEDFQRADITTKGNPLVICCCCDLVQPCNRSTLPSIKLPVLAPETMANPKRKVIILTKHQFLPAFAVFGEGANIFLHGLQNYPSLIWFIGFQSISSCNCSKRVARIHVHVWHIYLH